MVCTLRFVGRYLHAGREIGPFEPFEPFLLVVLSSKSLNFGKQFHKLIVQ